jgi:hypothetical protein
MDSTKGSKTLGKSSLVDVLLNCCDNQLTMVQHLTKAKETWDFLKAMYEHVDKSIRLVVKKNSQH